MSRPITIALAKGRILTDTLPLLARAGIEIDEDVDTTRKLIIQSTAADIRLIFIRAADVPTYVQFGAADLGIVGKDVLMEHRDDALYELGDLKVAKCRMVVAEPGNLARQDNPQSWVRLRIATKYVNTTRRHFARKGVQTEIIKLHGSMELAPLAGLADRIVDLVDTGDTMRANGLVEVEHIADISARLIANKASIKMKRRLKEMVTTIAQGAN
ncbi:MAG: ATP phosphoribosyltransferase [Gammaproteobacteria bacterium]|nr:ATP phosphoribosyltransferase [Gammaproteobacteria bacterium]